MTIHRFVPLSAMALGLALLTGCAARTSVGRILNEPYRYQNREVQVHGTVTGRVNAVVAGGYQLEDGTGRITVLSNGAPPRRGAVVSVVGRVTPGVSVFGNSFGVTLHESRRKVQGGYRSWP